jgi:hypothetical protein
MLPFSKFIVESTDTEKLKHLEHAEDHHINAGAAGFDHAASTLHGVHNAMQGKKSNVKITTKYDGAPSIVFGTHPETKKFFVASKSAFNKSPKINYTHADIEKNHGHAPGLVSKLSHALEHLPKVTPKGHVYQGDMMYAPGDVRHSKSHVHFKPNTIEYSAHKDSDTGKKVAAAKIGVAVHTQYHGKTLQGMKAKFGPDLSGFKNHSDVHVIDVEHKHNPSSYSKEHQAKFEDEMKKAQDHHTGHDYSHLNGHTEHVKTYINDTVRRGTKPTVAGLKAHAVAKISAKADALKTEKSKAAVKQKAAETAAHIDTHKDHFDKTLKIYHHVQNAKHALVGALASGGEFQHKINGKKTGPEGHVAIIDNKPTKLVDRSAGGFAAANLNAGGIAKQKKAK